MGFKKIEESGTLPGPRTLFICGFPENTGTLMSKYLKNKGLDDINIKLCREDSLSETISQVLSKESVAPVIPHEKLPPVMLWSGIDHNELDTALGDFAETEIPRPIFATTTEHNLNFTVKEFLQHMLSEQKSIREAIKKNQ